jgi:outer membrane protein insertion porin family
VREPLQDKHPRPFAVLVSLLFAIVPAFSQVGDLEGRQISSVVYVPAKQPLASQDLSRLQHVTAGSPYSARDVAETIDRLFATGAYSDIQVDVDPQPTGLVVKFLTKSTPFVGHIGVTGKVSTPPSRTNLVSAGEFTVGTPFEEEALLTAQKTIQQLFTGNGLYEAQVALEKNLDANTGLVEITIRVNAGKRARYEMPTILGHPKLSDSTIRRATGWRIMLIRRWRGVSQSLTNSGVENIRHKYTDKDLLTASVQSTSMDYDPDTRRVKPVLTIEAGPKIEVKAVEAKVGKGRLKAMVPIYQEGAVDNDLLFEGARNLRDYFQSVGYPDAEVDFRTTPVTNDHQTIEFIVSKGAPRKLVRVNIQGNRYFNTATIKERLFLLPASFRFRHGRYSDAFRKRDEETIATLYRSNGFHSVKVTSTALENYQGKPDRVVVTYHVDEGTQWLVSKFTTEGIEEKDFTAIESRLSVAPGEPYSTVSMDLDRNLILEYYYRHGYPKAAVDWKITPRTEDQPHQPKVDLLCRVTPGPQEFVRGVQVLGLTRTRPKLVQKHLDIHEGDPLSLPDIDRVQRSLDNLGVFARVDSAIENPDGDETYKYVLYDVDEASRYNVRVGVGAEIAQLGATTANLNAPEGRTGFSPRFLLDVDRIDFMGTGDTVSFDGRYSNLEQRLGVNYVIPHFLNEQGSTLTFSALYDVAANVQTFSAKREETSVQLSQKLSKPSTILFSYAYRRVSTYNIAIPDLLVPQLAQPIRIGIFSANYVQDRRDSPTNPTKGIYNTLAVGVASNFLGSERNFLRVLGRNATYYRLPRHMVLARQVTFGVIKPYSTSASLSPLDAVPLPERFFGGGDLTNRGFGENQAGPRDIGSSVGPDGTATQPTGFPIGGNALFFNNTELRFPLYGANIDGVFFHDMGNIYTNLSSMSFRVHQDNDQDFNYMVHAVGFGLRYRTPVGPIRADFAYSINPPHFVGFSGTINQLLNCNPSLPVSQLPSYCVGVPQQLSHFQFFFSIGQTF